MAWNTGTSYTAASVWGATQANGVGLDLRTWGGNVDAGGYNLSNLGDASIAAGKKLGIATAAPNTTLEVRGTSVANWGNVVINSENSAAALTFRTTAVAGMIAYLSHESGVFTIQHHNNGSQGPLLLNPNGGRVGLGLSGIPSYANNAAAVAGGLTAGYLYRTGSDPDTLCIVH